MLLNSTLRLEADKTSINYNAAWSIGNPSKSSATVTVVTYERENFLVTNAHAVDTATYLKVKLNQGSTEIPVKVVWIDPITDLAILKATTAEGENLIDEKTQPLEINPNFPRKGTEVNAYGYPSGGTSLSFTKGHVSRIEVSNIAFSGFPSVTVQTSAPINPGNSGGPITVEKEDKKGKTKEVELNEENKKGKTKEGELNEVCVGIVSQNIPTLSNVGYFIPSSTLIKTIKAYKKFGHLRQFLDYVTVPDLSFSMQELKNKHLRTALGLEKQSRDEELKGIRVTSVPRDSCAYNILKEGDIVIKIDGKDVLADGNVEVDELETPISYRYLIQQRVLNDNLEVVVLRKKEENKKAEKSKETKELVEGKKIEEPVEDSKPGEETKKIEMGEKGEISAKAKPIELEEHTLSIKLNKQLGQELLGNRRDKQLKYHIQPSGDKGGYVFAVCSNPLMSTFRNAYNASGKVIVDRSNEPLMFNDIEKLTKSGDLLEVIVLQNIFFSDDTSGYDRLPLNRGAVCNSSYVTEVNGAHIRNLTDLVEAFAVYPERYWEVKFANGKLLVIVPPNNENTKAYLQKSYRIPFFTSPSPEPIDRQPLFKQINSLNAGDDECLKPSEVKAQMVGLLGGG